MSHDEYFFFSFGGCARMNLFPRQMAQITNFVYTQSIHLQISDLSNLRLHNFNTDVSILRPIYESYIYNNNLCRSILK